MKKHKKTYHTVYVIKDGSNAYKIGITNDFQERFKTIQHYNPTVEPVMLYRSSRWTRKNIKGIEQFLHFKFQHKRILGEWFELLEEDVDTIFSFFNKKTKNVKVQHYGTNKETIQEES